MIGFALHQGAQPTRNESLPSVVQDAQATTVSEILRSKTYTPAEGFSSDCPIHDSANSKQASEAKHAPISVKTFGSNAPSWRETAVLLSVDKTLQHAPDALQALNAALLAWTSAATELPKISISLADSADDNPDSERGHADHRISYVPGGDARADGALAVTVLTIDEDDNSIVDADIVINGTYRFKELNADRPWGAEPEYDLQSVLTHEMGHWFGLPEDPCDSDATMYMYTLPNETKKRDLTQEDVDAVQVAYWQADNPSGEVGCSFVSKRSRGSALGFIGTVAVLLLARVRQSKRGFVTSTEEPAESGRSLQT